MRGANARGARPGCTRLTCGFTAPCTVVHGAGMSGSMPALCVASWAGESGPGARVVSGPVARPLRGVVCPPDARVRSGSRTASVAPVGPRVSLRGSALRPRSAGGGKRTRLIDRCDCLGAIEGYRCETETTRGSAASPPGRRGGVTSFVGARPTWSSPHSLHRRLTQRHARPG